MSEANETPPPKFKWKNAKEIGQEVEGGGKKKGKKKQARRVTWPYGGTVTRDAVIREHVPGANLKAEQWVCIASLEI